MNPSFFHVGKYYFEVYILLMCIHARDPDRYDTITRSMEYDEHANSVVLIIIISEMVYAH